MSDDVAQALDTIQALDTDDADGLYALLNIGSAALARAAAAGGDDTAARRVDEAAWVARRARIVYATGEDPATADGGRRRISPNYGTLGGT